MQRAKDLELGDVGVSNGHELVNALHREALDGCREAVREEGCIRFEKFDVHAQLLLSRVLRADESPRWRKRAE